MALSGLEIYKHLPKTNCKDCGFPTCLAFAMQLAAKKVSLDKCPHVSEEAKKVLEGASQPPIRLVTIGTGENKLELGNETVMFRHEERFYHPAGIGVLVEDTLDDNALKSRIDKINKLKFERVGREIKIDLIAVKNSSKSAAQFAKVIKAIVEKTKLNLILMSENVGNLKECIKVAKEKKPLLYCATKSNYQEMAQLAKEHSLPLAVHAENLEELADLTQKIVSLGVQDLVLDTGPKSPRKKICDLTYTRRMALKKTFRPLGYPTIVFTQSSEPNDEVCEAAGYVVKYAGIVITKGAEPWQLLPLLTVRSDIYTDPQKPVQVEPKVYEIGAVKKTSPVLVTTNFSITYFTVAGEVEASKIPAYVISCDAEGMSVLTAWAAEKFTAESIAKMLDTSGISGRISHKNVVIPGYVAVLSGKLEEESGWKVLVGPKEASGIPSYLRSMAS
ncbi:MAG: acetyl-CoA decarbonylase/synthase complex subunit gamma [Candidatus Omnitrophica bacterium CG07_land_8_20_14_0_80_42_15]|uniref:Acetyl-CoA decarbonylase/synthase complex subunit gamma n=1 Tax=Candidatus Aquitaenariimonas noxiae TaxID=1974741 RepID=A0A2J0L1S8_9BACT|nr:MAG: acetyl-CoA decarbonylase/synthase complex subunit gamma [Candidatus Omnitrophica bacterium CG07_land_8_20_14_0_80_42_15]